MVETLNGHFRKKQAVLVFLMTFLVYSPLLVNGFVGDDNTFFVRNTFYKSYKNIPRVFEKGCISDLRVLNFNSEPQFDFGTGSSCFRPVTHLTYFIDYSIFRLQPWGSHLINILFHCINSVLVYGIVVLIFSSSALGMFAALLFSLHPIQSEAVANVAGGRFDLLAAMFALSSFYFWMKFRQNGYVNHVYYGGSLAMYFLALFSKESAIMLPVVILMFDQALPAVRSGLRPRCLYYSGFLPVLIFHLYFYMFVFRNAWVAFHGVAGSFLNHGLVMGAIWFGYMTEIILPWMVKMIPGFYCPPVPGSLQTAEILTALFLMAGCFLMSWRRNQESLLFGLWFIIFYIPVSDLILLDNQMANRFMYLPSIGLLICLAFFIHKILNSDWIRKSSRYMAGILYGAVIMICVSKTLFLNGDWKSNFDVGYAWVRDYPTFGKGYALVGFYYYNAGRFDKACEYLEKSVQLGDRIPLDNLTLAGCYMMLGKSKQADIGLRQIISQYPDYADAYFLLGELYYNQGKNPQSQIILETALRLNPKRFRGYRLLMKVYLNLQEHEAAKDLLRKADSNLNAEDMAELRKVSTF
jgi:hypothetical protein